MTTTTSPQVRMINDIAEQFGHVPPEQAAKEIAQHVTKFWDPRMKTDLRKRAANEPDSFDPLALAAARLLG